MMGMEMMFKALGVDPQEVQAMIKAFGENAEAMRASQERTESMVREIHAHVFGNNADAKIENKE